MTQVLLNVHLKVLGIDHDLHDVDNPLDFSGKGSSVGLQFAVPGEDRCRVVRGERLG